MVFLARANKPDFYRSLSCGNAKLTL